MRPTHKENRQLMFHGSTIKLTQILSFYEFNDNLHSSLIHYKFVRLSTSYNQIVHLTSVSDILPIQLQNNSPLNQLTFINVERQRATDLLNAPYTSRSDRHATQWFVAFISLELVGMMSLDRNYQEIINLSFVSSELRLNIFRTEKMLQFSTLIHVTRHRSFARSESEHDATSGHCGFNDGRSTTIVSATYSFYNVRW